MKRKYSDNLMATIFLGIASFLTSGINYITTPIFTRLISTSEYGLISKYNSVYLIISVIATLTLARPGILSIGLYENKENRWRFLSTMLGEVLVSSLLVMAIITFFWRSISCLLSIPFFLMLLMIATCILQPALTFWTYKQRYEYKWKPTFFISVGTAILAQIISVIAVIWFKKNTVYNLGIVRLLSASAVNLSVSSILYVYILKQGKCFINLKLWKVTLLFALPLIPHYFGFALLTSTDKIMIGSLVGDDKVGIYSLAAVISTVGSLVWQALCVSITPFIYEKLGKREFINIDELTKPLLELIAVCCISISFFSPEIIAVMGTQEYADAAYVIPAAAAGTFMHVMYDLFSNVAFFNKKSLHIMCATLISALTNIVLNYIFIQKYGYVAAGYTTLFSYLILAILHYRISRYLEREKIFDWKYDVLISVKVITLCLSSILVYNIVLVRYLINLLLIGFILVRRKKYIRVLAEMRI